VITRKGETIVGVAIATALMPPLAVTGYGLAVGSMAVAGGSFFLFMTNLLAIALSVTVLSRIYGFGSEHSPRHTLGQTLLVIIVFVGLSVPLGLALRNIAYETTVTNTIKAEILVPFKNSQHRLGDIVVRFPKDDSIQVDATVLTYERVAGAEATLEVSLSERFERIVNVELDQVLINRDVGIEQAAFLELANTSLGTPLRAEISKLESLSQVRRTEAEVRQAAAFKLAGADIDGTARTATFFAAREAAFTVAAYRAMEKRLSENFEGWTIRVVPPIMDLPLIVFEQGEEIVTPVMMQDLDLAVWALEHWGVSDVEVVGYASSSGSLQNFDNQALAYRRADGVAAALRLRGFGADAVGEYRAFRQSVDERRLGYQRFQTVLIRPQATASE
jgi:outer membrane protein OmpA-like peptidoglycan-associated protein